MNEQEKLEVLKVINDREAQKQSPSIFDKMNNEIDTQYNKQKQELATNEEFVGLTKQVVERTVKAKLAEDMLEILTQEHKNELAEYYLKVQKEELQYRKKKEKKIIKQQIEGEIATKRLKALKERYSYMYSENEPFIPSVFYNRQREWANWWAGISENNKKLIKGTLKFLFWAGIGVFTVWSGVKIFNWIVENADKLSSLS